MTKGRPGIRQVVLISCCSFSLAYLYHPLTLLPASRINVIVKLELMPKSSPVDTKFQVPPGNSRGLLASALTDAGCEQLDAGAIGAQYETDHPFLSDVDYVCGLWLSAVTTSRGRRRIAGIAHRQIGFVAGRRTAHGLAAHDLAAR